MRASRERSSAANAERLKFTRTRLHSTCIRTHKDKHPYTGTRLISQRFYFTVLQFGPTFNSASGEEVLSALFIIKTTEWHGNRNSSRRVLLRSSASEAYQETYYRSSSSTLYGHWSICLRLMYTHNFGLLVSDNVFVSLLFHNLKRLTVFSQFYDLFANSRERDAVCVLTLFGNISLSVEFHTLKQAASVSALNVTYSFSVGGKVLRKSNIGEKNLLNIKSNFVCVCVCFATYPVDLNGGKL
ncbi:hypothetical protein F2P81_021585 [Scophthalmus maximus]|uniref:Uncharacterized protein n=1 Tax=Scophthalmus maximus TaxID=52904 RepID=A0A6A4S3V4_SCOMX|nr:hypothetical protein F2P81_021585 [Scophthalmus maximus]